MPRPTVRPVTSSNIASIAHDGENLYVSFKSGGTYRFDDVPAETFDAMCEAESCGKFFHANIKGKHTSSKLEDE